MYNFTDDWFSHNIPNFEKFLTPFKGIKCNFLEVGSYEGRSATWVLENILTHPESMLTCIEPGFCEKNDILKENLKRFNNVRLIEKPNKEACFDYLLTDFDFIYIDGSHSSKNCLFDIIISWTILKPGGIMAIDDYLWPLKEEGTSPKEAVDLFLIKNQCNILHKEYQVWLQKT